MRAIPLLLLLAACTSTPDLARGPGSLDTPFGTLWYNVVGEGAGTPAILLHGGPGFNSYYLNPMSALGSDRPLVLYDQIGSGRSRGSVDSTGWTIPNFVLELETLRAALGIERFHLIGHSWGTMLGAEYWRAHPERVASIVFMSPALSIPTWLADADTLLMTLPDSITRVVLEHETAGTFDDPAYQNAVNAFYVQFLARKQPWSADVDSAFAFANLAIYGYMWGPSEFTAIGTLQNFDATSWIGDIDVPVLFTTGEYDEARPISVRGYAAMIPGAEMAVIPDAAHLTMHDNPGETNRVVGEFLKRVDDS